MLPFVKARTPWSCIAIEQFNLPELGGTVFAGFIILGLVLGITLVWLYASIRPRFGPGPKTAICAGLFVWVLFCVLPQLGGVLMGFSPLGPMILPIVWGAIEICIAALVGGALYQEA